MNETTFQNLGQPKLGAVALAGLLCIGCASVKPVAPPPVLFGKAAVPEAAPSATAAQSEKAATGPFVVRPGPAAAPQIAGNLRPAAPATVPAEAAGDLSVNIEQMTLPTYIQAVYGGILRMNYSVEPAVAARTELVTFRTPKPMTAAKLADVTKALLASYGVTVQDLGGVLRIVAGGSASSALPQIRRGRAEPTVPLPLRPIFHYVETQAVRSQAFLGTLKSMLGTRVNIEADSQGGLLLSGPPEDVQVALELIQVFDQPMMRGQNSVRFAPRYWTADEFTRRLAEILRVEGYAVATAADPSAPIILLPLGPNNSVLVFAASEAVTAHVVEWARELDQPSQLQVGGAFFTYAVRNSDAQELAKSLNELIGGPVPTAATVPVGNSAAPIAGAAVASAARRRVVVNNATNTLIFQGGSPDEYRQWLTLLTDLDRPVKSVLIDVLVAEVALNDNSDLGFSWQLDKVGAGSVATRLAGGTQGDFKLSGTGVNVNALLGGNPLRQLAMSALSANQDARVISNPKIMTRNGENATITVGQEVPTVTSQAVASGTTAGFFGGASSSTVPQTVQYRSTGVILNVRPVIHAGDRVDLDVQQEVSSAEPTTTGVTTSPTIRNRRVQTKLSLRDGATVMLAGMISETQTDGDSGVPGLKDIPGLGALFKKQSTSKGRTELVMLITPYILNDSADAEAATDAFQNTLGDWAKTVRERSKAIRASRPAELGGVTVGPVVAPGVSGASQAPSPGSLALPAAPTSAAPAPNAATSQAAPSLPPKPQPRMIQLAKDPVVTTPAAGGVAAGGVAKGVTGAAGASPTSAGVSAPGGRPAASSPRSATPAPPLPPGVKPVTDPALLDELRKLIAR